MEKPACCRKDHKKGILQGIGYGLIPHAGCIAFIIFAILGVTTATALFKPLLMSAYFFYILIALSLVFATISAMIYLKRNGGTAKQHWKYLSILYGTTMIVNLLMFMVIFPYAANAISTGEGGNAQIKLQVEIPCPGHAPLIMDELKTINGMGEVKFSTPNIFDVSYDDTKTTKEEILKLKIFETYKATVLS